MIPIRDSVFCRTTPYVVIAIISANVLVFLYEIGLSPRASAAFIAEYALVPLRYTNPDWAPAHGLAPGGLAPFITGTFLHGGWLHVILNMWTLWIFGCALEDRLRGAAFAAFYVVCGIAASATHFAFNLTSPAPVLGASGAIAGVIGGYAVLFPRARVLILVPVIVIPLFFHVPAIGFALIWFAMQVLQGATELMQPSIGGGIAWWAHVGGFVTGAAIMAFVRAGHHYAPSGPWER